MCFFLGLGTYYIDRGCVSVFLLGFSRLMPCRSLCFLAVWCAGSSSLMVGVRWRWCVVLDLCLRFFYNFAVPVVARDLSKT